MTNTTHGRHTAEQPTVLTSLTNEALAALVEWRAVDQKRTWDDPEYWPSLMRLRDAADRLERVTEYAAGVTA